MVKTYSSHKTCHKITWNTTSSITHMLYHLFSCWWSCFFQLLFLFGIFSHFISFLLLNGKEKTESIASKLVCLLDAKDNIAFHLSNFIDLTVSATLQYVENSPVLCLYWFFLNKTNSMSSKCSFNILVVIA